MLQLRKPLRRYLVMLQAGACSLTLDIGHTAQIAHAPRLLLGEVNLSVLPGQHQGHTETCQREQNSRQEREFRSDL